jgi:hypothetical protein
MKKLILILFVVLATGSMNSYCEEPPEAAKRYGGQGGERPSDEQIAAWRAKRAARSGSPVASGAPTTHAAPAEQGQRRYGGSAENAVKPPGSPAASGKPAEGGYGGGRPGSGYPGGGRGGMLWLSDSPPSRGDGAHGGSGRPGSMAGMAGMAGMEMGGGGGRGTVPKKRFWLRAGSDPQRSGFAQEDPEAPAEIVLVTPDSKPEGSALLPGKDVRAGLQFEAPLQGFYRLYLTNRKLQGETLNVSIAKAEVANFTHGGDEEEAKKNLGAARYLETAELEIVRERKPDEKKFFRLESGDVQAFIVLRKGLPLQGARVRFISHQGWAKEAVSDEQGRVTFQLIRDYFPPWNDFQKRFKAAYLVTAEFTSAEPGKYKEQQYTGIRYQTSLSGSYYPASDDYLSYSWGLGIGLLITLFSGVSVYLYRRRRVKPFQEVRFAEQRA